MHKIKDYERKWVIVNQERTKLDKLELQLKDWRVTKSALASENIMLTCERIRK